MKIPSFPAWLITSTLFLLTPTGSCCPQCSSQKTSRSSNVRATKRITLDELWKTSRRNQQAVLEHLHDRQFEAVQWVAERMLRHVRLGQKKQAFERAESLSAFGLSAFACDLRNQERILALVDTRGANGGYLFRFGQNQAELILQSPHRFFDTATGVIARKMFVAAPLRAFFFNTAHRFGKDKDQSKKGRSNDVAWADKTIFAALTLAAAKSFESPLVMQLHGFGNSTELAGVDAIVSSGATSASRQVTKVSRILQSVGGHVLHYPTQVGVLGGEENAIGRHLVETNVPFVHLELSEAFRSRIRSKETSRRLAIALAQAFAGSGE